MSSAPLKRSEGRMAHRLHLPLALAIAGCASPHARLHQELVALGDPSRQASASAALVAQGKDAVEPLLDIARMMGATEARQALGKELGCSFLSFGSFMPRMMGSESSPP